jgi:RNA polymerase sigma-70 factor, ECF subfamily
VYERAPTEDQESELVSRAIEGDEGAFTQLYDRYYDRILRHVYYRVGRMEDAEDLTQQSFLQAWRALGRYRQTGTPFVAWLFTISHNVVVSFYRRQRPSTSLDSEILDWPGDSRPDEVAELGLEYERVRVAMQKLKPEQQQVLAMRFLEDLPFRDIATALGKSEVNVRVMQHRALQELRKVMERNGG